MAHTVQPSAHPVLLCIPTKCTYEVLPPRPGCQCGFLYMYVVISPKVWTYMSWLVSNLLKLGSLYDDCMTSLSSTTIVFTLCHRHRNGSLNETSNFLWHIEIVRKSRFCLVLSWTLAPSSLEPHRGVFPHRSGQWDLYSPAFACHQRGKYLSQGNTVYTSVWCEANYVWMWQILCEMRVLYVREQLQTSYTDVKWVFQVVFLKRMYVVIGLKEPFYPVIKSLGLTRHLIL